MKDWSRLFRSYSGSGVYTVKSAAAIPLIEQSVKSCGLYCVDINLSAAGNKEDFLTAVAGALKFPDYFGMNWDAFEECMTDLSWCPANGYALIFNGTLQFARSDPHGWRTAQKILRSTAGFWKKQKIPFFVIMVTGSG